MKFGVFDHMDRADVPLGLQYEERLQLIAGYEAAGFHAYHLAEHHSTPLGMAPSPSVFLGAVAQRTKRLRFGPLVYTLSLHHPLRVIEEICMLDQMSSGRFELGVGRGISPHEVSFYGVDPAVAPEIYREAYAVILQGLTERRVDFQGKHFNFRDVPIEMQPVQKPHPPLWYGVARPELVDWPARNKLNIVTNVTAETARAVTDRYRREYAAAGHGPNALPLLGMGRYIIVAETDRDAGRIARRAYQRWYASFILLWDKLGGRPPFANYPPTYDEVEQRGYGVAGTPTTVRDALERQIRQSGINYLVCRFAFGDLTLRESQRSLGLFTREVMPALAWLG
jgi:alkanesulfonate monooxygenase SsuD/methylene tetrahydromethanopterin reductase-like flavin-dependent oxidoreductase (luciferase family)